MYSHWKIVGVVGCLHLHLPWPGQSSRASITMASLAAEMDDLKVILSLQRENIVLGGHNRWDCKLDRDKKLWIATSGLAGLVPHTSVLLCM